MEKNVLNEFLIYHEPKGKITLQRITLQVFSNYYACNKHLIRIILTYVPKQLYLQNAFKL